MHTLSNDFNIPTSLHFPKGIHVSTAEFFREFPQGSIISGALETFLPIGVSIDPKWEKAVLSALDHEQIPTLLVNLEVNPRLIFEKAIQFCKISGLEEIRVFINDHMFKVDALGSAHDLTALFLEAVGVNDQSRFLYTSDSFSSKSPSLYNSIACAIAFAREKNCSVTLIPSRGLSTLTISPDDTLGPLDFDHDGPRLSQHSQSEDKTTSYVKPITPNHNSPFSIVSYRGAALGTAAVVEFEVKGDIDSAINKLLREQPISPGLEVYVQKHGFSLFFPAGTPVEITSYWGGLAACQGSEWDPSEVMRDIVISNFAECIKRGRQELAARLYYERIDNNKVDAILSMFRNDAIYMRADTTLSGKNEISNFYKRDRKIQITHEIHSIVTNDSIATVRGHFSGRNATGKEISGDFCDFWEFDKNLMIVKRNTLLGLGSSVVRS